MTTRRYTPGRRSSGGMALLTLLFGLVILMILALALPRLFGTGPMKTAQPAATTTPLTSAAPRIDPEPFRERITTLERILYKSTPAGLSDADLISQHALQLSLALRATGFEPGRARAQQRIAAFAGIVEMQADAGYAVADLADLRSRWQQARNAVFAPAPWFRTSTAEPAEP